MDFKQHNNRNISRLGFGCMRFPLVEGSDWKIDEEKAKALLLDAYNKKVNYFDTAYPYHNRTSEEFVGRVLKTLPREEINIATKMPINMIKNGLIEAEGIFKQQLINLQTDYIDYYLLHAINLEGMKKSIESGIYDFLDRKRKEGVIRNFGFSFHGYATDLDEMIGMGDFDFVQLQLNYVDYSLQNAKLSYETVTKHNLPVMVMEPVRGGALTTLTPEAISIMKNYNPDASIASWAFRWVSSLDNVLVVLSGMNDHSQLDDNIRTFSPVIKLNKDEIDILDEVTHLFLQTKSVPCTKCHYCMPCALAGIDIPTVFEIYNTYLIDHDGNKFKKEYLSLTKNGGDCVSCKRCMKSCPQSINIAENMKQIDRSAMSLNT